MDIIPNDFYVEKYRCCLAIVTEECVEAITYNEYARNKDVWSIG